ncbi:MAG: type IV pilus modification PilV family protein [Polyangia bacterium]
MRLRARDRGTSLVEVMLSMGIALVGVLALFRVLVTSITGSATASHLTQAQLRAATLVEAMRLAPRATLSCLSATTSASWSTCGAPFVLSSPDRSGQIYLLDPSSAVTVAGANGGAFDVRVVVGFNDDNSTSTGAASGYHSVALRTGIYP